MQYPLDLLCRGLADLARWEARWPAVPEAPELYLAPERMSEILDALVARLEDNYPFFHPQYVGQMLKPPHALAQLAYALAMTINPNNHALDGGPATAAMEREAVAALARMFGFPEHIGHLTGGGTMANLEALWVARCLHPGRAIAASTQAHYTHARAAEVLGIRHVAIGVDAAGRMDLAALEAALASGEVGTVVATSGTTALGAVDPVEGILPIARAHCARVHVDAAYGGFYRLLADQDPPLVPQAAFQAIALADSVAIDPHKHGLQPYGCGCVIFRDPEVGRFYRHDSPYTYFTTAELHLGEISLECSRPGAAAAALWATLQGFPLAFDRGLGPVLAACRRAALGFASRLDASASWQLVTPPELDILAYFPTGSRASEISSRSERIFQALMSDPREPLYLAKLVLPRELASRPGLDVAWDVPSITVLRSCLLKPEHAPAVPWLFDRLERGLRAIG